MVWVRVRVPARSLFSPLLSVVKVVGFCCGAPPGAPAFCFPAVCGACFLGGAPGGLAGVSGGCSAFFLRVVSACVVVFVFACVHGSLCGVLRGVEGLVCVLGCLLRASPRWARAAWFLYVLWSRGVARVLWRCYFVAIVVVSLVGCPVAGARVFLTDWARAGGRVRFHVNNQGRVLPCRAKHACRFGASFENGGGGANCS